MTARFFRMKHARRTPGVVATAALLVCVGVAAAYGIAEVANGAASSFNVRPGEGSYAVGWNWAADSSVDIDVDDPGTGTSPDYSISADTDDDGSFWTEVEIEIQSGYEVEVSDGVTTKIHTVTDLDVTDLDASENTIAGTAEPGADVIVSVWDEGAELTTLADGEGEWSVDFDDIGLDLFRGHDGCAVQQDLDGDGTQVDWHIPNPVFRIDPHDDNTWGHQWPADTEITIEIDDPDNGAGVDFSETAMSNEWGDFDLSLGEYDYDAQAGDEVTVSDGATDKTTIVTELFVTDVDVEADTVSGTAEPGSDVRVDAYPPDEDGTWRDVTADGEGDWTVDFSVEGPEDGQWICDIDEGISGAACQEDEDGDTTQDNWNIPRPVFRIDPHDDNTWGHQWPADTEITIEIDDPDNGAGVDFSETAMSNEWGDFDLYFGEGAYDAQAGDEVTVSDGDTAKTTIVTELVVVDIDPDTDTVSGTAEPGSDVRVDAYPPDEDGTWRDVTADGEGDWTADFSVDGPDDNQRVCDITKGMDGAAFQTDEDWDGTWDNWCVPNPRFEIDPYDEGIWGSEWLADTEITIEIDDPDNGAGVDFSESVMSNEWGDFDLSLGEYDYDAQAGDEVTVSDGATDKTTIVTELFVTDVDVEADTVSGTAEPGSDVRVDAYPPDEDGTWRDVTADGEGDWTADFSVDGPDDNQRVCDITKGMDGAAFQTDEDGDTTRDNWRVPNPVFRIDPHHDSVFGSEWLADTGITVEIDDPDNGAGVDFSESVMSNEWGDFDLSLGEYDYDAQAGDEVTVSDGATAKTTVATELVATDVDPDTDTVSGVAEPGSNVVVDIWTNDDSGCWREVTADGEGDWTADFSVEVGGEEWQRASDIVPGTEGSANQEDEDGDGTWDNWRAPNPRFEIDPYDESAWGCEWPADTEIAVEIDDPDNGAGIDYSETAMSNEWGEFDLYFGEGAYDAQAGDEITVSDGDTVKTTIVTELLVTEVDPDADTVSGTAEPGSDVTVDIWTNDDSGCWREVTADGGGDWTADFSVEGQGDEEWQREYDLEKGTDGAAYQADDDGDSTRDGWNIPNPVFRIDPHRGDVWGHEWDVDSEIMVEVDDPDTTESPDLSETVMSNEWGDFSLWLGDYGFHAEAGDEVTVDDGASIKTTIITELEVTDVDADADTVSGTAEPGTSLQVDAYPPDAESAWREVTANGEGEWMVDFSVEGPDDDQRVCDIELGMDGAAFQSDEDGDYTWDNWHVADPYFWVSPIEPPEHMWGGDWTPDDSVDIAIDDPATPSSPDYETSAATDVQGTFEIYDIPFDIQAGFVVTVSDDYSSKEHTVIDLRVTDISTTDDAITGVADPDSPVELWYYDESSEQGYRRSASPDGAGNWSIDCSIAAGPDPSQAALDIVPGMDLFIWQSDEDEDSTQLNVCVADDVAPETHATGIPGTWTNAAVHVTLAATDDFSGVADTFYSINGGAAITYTAPFTLDAAGVFEIDYWSEDNEGNIETPSTGTVRIDLAAPVTASDAVASYVDQAKITLTRSDAGGSGVAVTYYSLDGTQKTYSAAFTVTGVGNHTLEYWSVDVVGNTETKHSVLFDIVSSQTVYVPVAGDNRYETAIMASQAAFDSAECVVIATGTNWPDALGGASLAAAKDGPILLTKPDALPSAVLTEIDRLGATEAIILGGNAAVSASVQSTLDSKLGTANVSRIGGSNRYETADLVAAATVAAIKAAGGTYSGTAFVATGANFPDALAASPLAAAKGWPLYLAKSTGLTAATEAAMSAAGVNRVLILGGQAVVSSTIETGLKSTYGAGGVTRLAGDNRYDTAVVVADYGCATADLHWDGLALATGQNFPDALAGGVLQGKDGSVLLLTPSTYLHADTKACLSQHVDEIAEVKYLGGEGAVSVAVRQEVASLLD